MSAKGNRAQRGNRPGTDGVDVHESDSTVTLPDEEVHVEDIPGVEHAPLNEHMRETDGEAPGAENGPDAHGVGSTSTTPEEAAGSDGLTGSELDGSSSALAHAEYPAIDPISSADADPEAMLALKNLEERRRKRKRGRIVRGAIIGAVIVGAIAAWAIVNAPKEDPSQVMVPKVVAAAREDLTESVNTTGSLKPISVVAVTPEVSGIIESVSVEEGQTVERGDELFTIRSKDVEKSLNQAQKDVDKAQRGVDKAYDDVNKAQSQLDDARARHNDEVDAYNDSLDEAEEAANEAYDETYDATYDEVYEKAIDAIPEKATKEERKKLKEQAKEDAKSAAEEAAQAAYDARYAEVVLPDPGSFDESTYDDAIDTANSSVTDAEDTLSDARDTYNEAEEEAGHRTVTAPASGVVLSLSAVEGASVGGASGGTSTASSDTLAQIADISSLKVNSEVNEIDVANIAEAQKAEVTFSSFPDILEDAKVTSVASVATGSSSNDDSSSSGGGGVVTFAVETVIDKPDNRLKPGMTANVEIFTKEVPNVIVVPTAAIVYEEDGTYVEVVAGEDEESVANPEKRKVELGESTKTDIEVKKGLSEGELVLAGTTTADAAGLGDLEGTSSGDAADAGGAAL